MLYAENGFFQDDSSIIHTFRLSNRCLRCMTKKVLQSHIGIRISSWLNIELLWSVLENNWKPISSYLQHNLYRNFYNISLRNDIIYHLQSSSICIIEFLGEFRPYYTLKVSLRRANEDVYFISGYFYYFDHHSRYVLHSSQI